MRTLAFGFDPRIYSIFAGRHGGGHAGYYVSRGP